METDAKGQVGGLESGDSVRKDLAARSISWTCPGCRRSNADILEECTQRARQEEGGDAVVEKENVQIPDELRLAYKDEMPVAAAAQTDEKAQEVSSSVETPITQRAESAYPPAQPAQSVPQATATIQHPQPPAVHHAQQQQRQLHTHDGVPVWVDRSITLIGFCLVLMLFKIILGY